MTSQQNPHGARQIIDFVENSDPSNKNRMLHLNEDVLSTVFQAAGERRIAIISIAGPSRKGKSFFLDFLIRYLEAFEKDDSDWMDWDDKNKPLEGFSWRTSIERETSGIVIWSKPFIIKANGKEIAVVLMDTQGTYDEYTTEREMSAIVGLTLLSSSCLIFNFFNSIQEDVFNSLDTYIKYGQLALGGDDDDMEVDQDNVTPFQKLVFLIRDWNMPTEFQYGSKGGKAYLAEKLKIKDGLTEMGVHVRKSLRQCFSELDCCLLPTLGEKAMQKGFNGSLAQLSPNFCKKLEEMINDLLNPDDLPLKSVFGNEILAVDMPNYFRQYVQVFNQDELPSPLSLMEASAQISNAQLVTRSVRKYTEFMKRKQRGKQFMGDGLLASAHKAAMAEAMKEFKSARKLGSKESIQTFEEELNSKISETFARLENDNKTKRAKLIDNAVESCIKTYKEALQSEFEDEDAFLEEKKLKNVAQAHQATALSELKENLTECDDALLEQTESELEKKLAEEQEKCLQDNKTRKLAAEKKMSTAIKGICNLYEQDLSDHLDEDKYITLEELDTYDKETRPDFVKRFDKVQKLGPKDFMLVFRKNLDSDLQELFEKIKNNQEILLNNVEAETSSLLDQTLAESAEHFRSELNIDDHMAKEQAQIQSTEVAMKSLKSRLSIPVESKIGQSTLEKLRQSLPVKFEEVVKDAVRERQECEASYKDAIEEAYNIYVEDILQFIGICFCEEDELDEKHPYWKERAFATFSAFSKTSVHPHHDQFMAQLDQKIEKYYEESKLRNSEKRKLAISTAQNAVHEHHQTYQKEMMNNLNLAKDQDHFTALHKGAITEALTSFNKICLYLTASIIDPLLEELNKSMETTFNDELLDVFELKLMERESGTTSAIADARKLYREEMEKHYKNSEFMRPKDLEELHNNMSTLAIDKAKEKAPISEIQLKDLEAALLETFQVYQEKNDMNVPVDPAIGIDLGTTYSCVGVYLNGQVKIIQVQGKNTLPSYVSYKDNGISDAVGTAAKETCYDKVENTVFDAKRIIGRSFDDPALQNDMKYWPFTVVEEKQVPKIEIGSKKLFPEQVSAEILKEIRTAAEKYLGCSVENAVITVPAYFNDGQRQATIDAGELAGLKVLNVLSEPVAATVAYKLQHTDDSQRHVLTFDLGGGTFDVAVIKISKGKIETLAVDGDAHLGGEDFDQNLMKHCSLQFQVEHGIDLMDGKDSTSSDKTRVDVRKRLKRLQLECERRKIALASCRSVDVAVDGIWNEAGVSTDLKVNVTREMFEQMNSTLFERTITIVDRCLASAGLNKSSIEDIVLVGGSTWIPKVQELLSDYFEGRALNHTINPDEAVAYGAAVQAAVLHGKIAQESIDFNNIQDVTPMSLGVEVYGGGFSVIIPKNTKIPIKFKEQYRTAHNNQTSVQITVYQGEAHVAKDNNWLGEFLLNNIPPADAGKETIDVTMEINMQGVLHVTAVCTSTGDKGSIKVVEHKRRMGKDQIKRILDEARPGGA